MGCWTGRRTALRSSAQQGGGFLSLQRRQPGPQQAVGGELHSRLASCRIVSRGDSRPSSQPPWTECSNMSGKQCSQCMTGHSSEHFHLSPSPSPPLPSISLSCRSQQTEVPSFGDLGKFFTILDPPLGWDKRVSHCMRCYRR